MFGSEQLGLQRCELFIVDFLLSGELLFDIGAADVVGSEAIHLDEDLSLGLLFLRVDLPVRALRRASSRDEGACGGGSDLADDGRFKDRAHITSVPESDWLEEPAGHRSAVDDPLSSFLCSC